MSNRASEAVLNPELTLHGAQPWPPMLRRAKSCLVSLSCAEWLTAGCFPCCKQLPNAGFTPKKKVLHVALPWISPTATALEWRTEQVAG